MRRKLSLLGQKILSFFMALMIMLSNIGPGIAYAMEEGESDDYYNYELYKDGYYIKSLTKKGRENLKENSYEISIPEEFKDIPVVGIKEAAFKNEGVLKLNLSKNIKYIEDEAFYNDKHVPSLSEITMDGGYIEEVGKKAFYGNNIKVLDIAIKHFKEDSFANNKIEKADLTYAKSFEKTSFRENNIKKVILNINSSYEKGSFNEDAEIEEVKEDLGEDEENSEDVNYLKLREDRLKEEANKKALKEEKPKIEEAKNVKEDSIESKKTKEEKVQVKEEIKEQEVKEEDKKKEKEESKESKKENEETLENSDFKLVEPKKLNDKEYKDLKDKNKVPKRLSFKDFLIKTSKAAEISEADGTKIESISSSWIYSNNKDGLLSLDWYNNEEQYVRFRTSYSLSGQHDYDPGMIQITIPKYIFKDRDGKVYGKMSLGVPELPGGDSEFAYYDTGDEYILINVKKIKAASQGFFEGSIKSLIPILTYFPNLSFRIKSVNFLKFLT